MFRVMILVASLLLAFGVYYFMFSPTAKYKAVMQQELNAFALEVASQKSERVKAMLEKMVSDDAKIQLKIMFPMPGMKTDTPPAGFDKAGFIQFVDLSLYSLSSYSFSAKMGALQLAEDHSTGVFSFSADGAANDAASPLMAAAMRFTADISCKGQVAFGAKPTLKILACDVLISR